MPVMDGYLHADTPHAKTVAGPDHRYGCHSDQTGPKPRGGLGPPLTVQTGWTDDGRRETVIVQTPWLDKPCGHNFRVTDPCCTGCHQRDQE